MIATDGQVTDEARSAAAKLGVEIREIPAKKGTACTGRPSSILTFDVVWQSHVAALVGRTLVRADGTSNQILSVDGGGVVRRTSGGGTQRLEIEIFRWTIERLLAGDIVTRKAIDERYVKRGSSGVVLILSATSLFETTKVSGKIALKRRPASGA